MSDSLVERLQAVRKAAKAKTDSEKRAGAARIVEDRTKKLAEWSESLDDARARLTVLATETATGHSVPAPVPTATAHKAVEDYETTKAWTDGCPQTKAEQAWKALEDAIEEHRSDVDKPLRDNVTERKKSCLDKMSPKEIGELATVPGFGEAAEFLRKTREDVAKAAKNHSAKEVRAFVEKVLAFYAQIEKLGETGDPPPEAVKTFCAKAKSTEGAKVSDYTDEVREWFESVKQAGRLRIKMT